MAYSDFSLSKVEKEFNLTLVEKPVLLKDVQQVKPSSFLENFIDKYASLALAINTEKARSELLISPILLDVKDIFSGKVSLFSGSEFTVDPSVGLSGVCDFLISKSPKQLLIEAPAVIVVEAKKEDIIRGLGQCVAEMIAAQRFNEHEKSPVDVIYGSVTTGDRWKFLKLEGNVVTIELAEHVIPPVDYVLGVLVSFLSGGAI